MAPSIPSTQIAIGNAFGINATMPCAVNVTVPAMGYPCVTKGNSTNNIRRNGTVTTCFEVEVKESLPSDESSCHGIVVGSPRSAFFEATVCHPHTVSLDDVDHLVYDNYYHYTPKGSVPRFKTEKTDKTGKTDKASTPRMRRDAAATANTPDISKLAVDSHNKVRAKHGAQPLRWNQELANYAQAVADTCKLAHNVGVGAETGKYGQSIASWGTNGVEHRTIEELVVDGIEVQWYSGEIGKYPGYGQAQPPMEHFHDWGHVSQTLWAATTEVGCAIRQCPAETHPFPDPSMGGHLMFCNYRAPGNVPLQYAENVKPPVA